MAELPRILVIAGSDSSGGAGIQADLKTITGLGGYGMSAITAITAQNTQGVFNIWPQSLDCVLAQARACLEDIGADCIKTGMLGPKSMIEGLAEFLLNLPVQDRPKRIVDPVMVASTGAPLLEKGAMGALKALFLPEADLVTPNAPEAELLTARTVETLDGQKRAADALLEAGARAALVKGGHISGGDLHDVLHTRKGEWVFTAPRRDTRHTHGTGCTLASAIATCLGHGLEMPEACQTAQSWLQGAIAAAPGLGHGIGPVHHGWHIPPYKV